MRGSHLNYLPTILKPIAYEIRNKMADRSAENFPFHHKIGERLKSRTKNLEGIVRNAKYAGTEDGKSAWITYYIETDTGEIIQLPSTELEKVGQLIQQPCFIGISVQKT